MNPYNANLINAILLIILGAWGYFGSEDPSTTALIPVAFGLVFALSSPLFKKGNKLVVHLVVALTFLLVIALFMPLKGAIERNDTLAIIRVGIMLLGSIFALAVFVKSFIDARKARQAGA